MKKGLFLYILFFSFHYSFSQSGTNSYLNLFFDINKYELGKGHLALIDSGIVNKKITVTSIRGFADSTGSNAFNMELSRKRADAVYAYLRNQHYIDSAINIEYFGEHQASGKDISYDRRVQICFKETVTLEKRNIDTVVSSERYELNNIYFIPDKAVIDPVSFLAVDEAANYLKNFPLCKFEIVGHVNYVLPPDVMNNPRAMEPVLKLSEERAKTVYDLLAERGIPFQNMTYKGVGNSQMYLKNPKNEEEKRKNMRVEILISCKK